MFILARMRAQTPYFTQSAFLQIDDRLYTRLSNSVHRQHTRASTPDSCCHANHFPYSWSLPLHEGLVCMKKRELSSQTAWCHHPHHSNKNLNMDTRNIFLVVSISRIQNVQERDSCISLKKAQLGRIWWKLEDYYGILKLLLIIRNLFNTLFCRLCGQTAGYIVILHPPDLQVLLDHAREGITRLWI